MLPPKHCNINLTGPISRWDEAIPLGNGILGSLFWGSMEHLRISVDIAGLWLRRRPEEKLDKEFTYAKLVELARKGPPDAYKNPRRTLVFGWTAARQLSGKP